jgi:hypothetical protein
MRYRYQSSRTDPAELIGMVLMLAFVAASIVAWGTHVAWTIHKLSSDVGATMGQIFLGVIGAFVPPVGAIHGVMIWFGY